LVSLLPVNKSRLIIKSLRISHKVKRLSLQEMSTVEEPTLLFDRGYLFSYSFLQVNTRGLEIPFSHHNRVKLQQLYH
jgi:hypothetical protein